MSLFAVSVSPVSVSAPVPGVVARFASGAGASFLCVRPSVRSFSRWVAVALFSSSAAAGSFAAAAASRFGFSFCAVRSRGSWFAVSVPCSVSWFASPGGSLPCLWSSFGAGGGGGSAPSCPPSSPSSPSPAAPFAGVVSVGFSGSRSLSPAASAALSSLLPLVPAGVRVSVGCAAGADAVVRSWFGASSSLLVFSVASGRFGVGRSAFARRSSRCVLSVASGSRGLLAVLPSSPVPPAGVAPSRSFRGGGSGSWGSAAFALGRGRRVLLWLPSGSRPPLWSGVSWSSAGALGSAGCWWLGVPAPRALSLSLF
ncbi:MAG: hypothetical protein QNJ55_25750 [Xenococcus sp. MO_188.B8]|nr:hypothetical protein [Xenococcus sp. MO_188.B8]